MKLKIAIFSLLTSIIFADSPSHPQPATKKNPFNGFYLGINSGYAGYGFSLTDGARQTQGQSDQIGEDVGMMALNIGGGYIKSRNNIFVSLEANSDLGFPEVTLTTLHHGKIKASSGANFHISGAVGIVLWDKIATGLSLGGTYRHYNLNWTDRSENHIENIGNFNLAWVGTMTLTRSIHLHIKYGMDGSLTIPYDRTIDKVRYTGGLGSAGLLIGLRYQFN